MFLLTLRNGDPFQPNRQLPKSMRDGFDYAKHTFRYGSLSLEGDEVDVPDENLQADFGATLLTISEALFAYSEGSLWSSEQDPVETGSDGIALALGAYYLELIEYALDWDSAPPLTRISTGKYISQTQHIGALMLVQFDRALTELSAGNASNVAALFWDVACLMQDISGRDGELQLEVAEQLPKVNAKEHGRMGGMARHANTREIKEWAIAEAKGMRGADIEIARQLVARLPQPLRDNSRSPERLIYETLRASRRKPG